jgi:hypothetical protein
MILLARSVSVFPGDIENITLSNCLASLSALPADHLTLIATNVGNPSLVPTNSPMSIATWMRWRRRTVAFRKMFSRDDIAFWRSKIDRLLGSEPLFLLASAIRHCAGCRVGAGNIADM